MRGFAHGGLSRGMVPVVFLAVTMCSGGDRVVAPPGAYLGQTPPGMTPQVFAPGVVSKDRNEVSCALTPDGREFYFGVFEPGRGYTMLVMTETGDGWLAPRPTPFSSGYSEIDMFITTEGDRLFFISKRPATAGAQRSPVYRVWVTDRRGKAWGLPRLLGPAVNSGERELFPTLSDDGSIVFGSDRKGGYGGCDIYMAMPDGDDFEKPENLGPTINSANDETDALIAPDGGFLIFTSVNREDGHGGGDLYISFRDSDGQWLPAVNMGETINTPHSEFCPSLSPDGEYFFFTSNRQGTNDLFWVDASIIDSFRSTTP